METSEEPIKIFPLYEMEFLFNARLGLYKIITVYSDGTQKEMIVPKGPIITDKFYIDF